MVEGLRSRGQRPSVSTTQALAHTLAYQRLALDANVAMSECGLTRTSRPHKAPQRLRSVKVLRLRVQVFVSVEDFRRNAKGSDQKDAPLVIQPLLVRLRDMS